MKRIAVLGTSGSGKSTLACQLATKLDLTHIELDQHWHLPGWTTRSEEDFQRRIQSLTEQDRWVVDGNYRRVQAWTVGRADTVIWLDYPRPIVTYRILSRTLRRCLTRETVCNGNRETILKSFFDRQSVIVWSISTHAKMHARCLEFVADPANRHLTMLHFRHPRETRRWFERIP